jgi:hypothetical protein
VDLTTVTSLSTVKLFITEDCYAFATCSEEQTEEQNFQSVDNANKNAIEGLHPTYHHYRHQSHWPLDWRIVVVCDRFGRIVDSDCSMFTKHEMWSLK